MESVTESDAIAFDSPVSVNDWRYVNWPPKAREESLENHVEAGPVNGRVSSFVCRFAPDDAVNRNRAWVTSRGVENPVTVTSNPLEVRVTVAERRLGAALRTRIVRGGVTPGTGVDPVANDVVKTIVPASVPD